MNKWIVILDKSQFIDHKVENFSNYKLMQKNYVSIYYELDGRFNKGQVFFENQDYLIILDGIILNSSELMTKYNTSDILSTVLEMYYLNGEQFISELRGFFSGYFYDVTQNKMMCFTNQTGDSVVFNYNDEKNLIFSSDFNLIVSFLKENSTSYTLNDNAVRYMLTFGFMIDDSTFIKEIKRITSGNYSTYDGVRLRQLSYHKFSNKSIDVYLDDAIELVDKAFRKAIKRCFDKDLEYGYTKHLVDMSAGMDSRMTNWVAKDMGYHNMFNISYSQLNSDEHKIATLVSSVLDNEFVHKSLDDVSFLYGIDEIIQKNYGLSVYFGITGGKQLLESLNYNKFGLEHTGQLGDVVVGTFLKGINQEKVNVNTSRYSNVLSINFNEKIVEKYENQELYNLYTRGFLGALSTHIIRRNYTYTVSPFLDVDFLSLCFSIPLEYRINHKLYWAWVDKKYPNASKVPSTRQRSKGINALSNRIHDKIRRESFKVLSKLKIVKYSVSKNSMNPFQYWYDTNSQLRSFISKYYEDNISKLDNNSELRRYVEEMYKSENTIDKLMSLSVLGVLKIYF